ncbi:hypothetical protein [Pseudomonas sp. B8(2017)]|uniref:hypothetical protein n=1 Tax=Pseudomonas sp. B8(2017) TaxID=1981711 RepID=UPI00111C3281|nr:hypothetical protein [Pseudomonas sp. B8(2017)]
MDCPIPQKPVFKAAPAPSCPPESADHSQSVSDDRSISINIGQLLPPNPKAEGALQSTLGISDKKVYTVKVENDTDWPAVIASLVVGLAIAWLAKQSQQSQIKSSAANFRNEWQSGLRSKIAEFSSKVALIHYKLDNDKDYLNKDASDEIFSELIYIQSIIELMLDSRKESSKQLTRTIEEVVRELKSGRTELGALLNKLNSQASDVLEQAWQDIRRDLGMKVSRGESRFRFWRNS